jgi:hypothetical protein
MREVEKRIGAKLEDDYREYYFEGGHGQTALANRVCRSLVFHSTPVIAPPSWGVYSTAKPSALSGSVAMLRRLVSTSLRADCDAGVPACGVA